MKMKLAEELKSAMKRYDDGIKRGIRTSIAEIDLLISSHKKATGECESGCDFITAWETAIEKLTELMVR